MSTRSDRIKPPRTALLATVLGLNLSLAAMLTVVASAFGWLGGHPLWGCWLTLAGLLAMITTRRLYRALAPLFWVSGAMPVIDMPTSQLGDEPVFKRRWLQSPEVQAATKLTQTNDVETMTAGGHSRVGIAVGDNPHGARAHCLVQF